jgi:hypothetical protein
MGFKLTPDVTTALLKGIGAGLPTEYVDVFTAEIPDRIAELLRRLDQPAEAPAKR